MTKAKHVLGSSAQRSPVYRSRVRLEYKFFAQLISLFLCVKTYMWITPTISPSNCNINLKTPCRNTLRSKLNLVI